MRSEPRVEPSPLPPLDPPRSQTHITISLSVRTLVMVGAAIAFFVLFRALAGIIIVFPIAILIATAVDKPAKWLGRHHIPRPTAILLLFTLLFAAIAATVALLIPLVSHEVRTVRSGLPAYRTDLEDLLNRFNSGQDDAKFSLAAVTTSLSGQLETLATHLTSITLDASRLALALFVTLVIAIMMALDPSIATNFARRFLSPARGDRLSRITASIDTRIGYWVRGQILIALTFGTLFGLGLGIIGVPFALTLGVTAAVLEVVPY